jgi:prepilin-type N-terminal cleavage/methylation domain-containing protein
VTRALPIAALRRAPPRSQRGGSMVELMIALVVLSLGVLAVSRLFPAGTRSQLQSRMLTSASYYAQQKLEDLAVKAWNDPTLLDGRHPAGTATESLGATGQWKRHYEVATMAAPLDNLKKVTVTVSWTFMGARQIQSTTYLRR